MSTALSVKGLRTEIRTTGTTVRAVDDVSFTIAAGETVGLVGESGCGKSMVAMSLMRLLPLGGHVVSGSVHLDGRDLTMLAEHEMRQVRGNDLAVIFQDPMTSLNPTMPIGDQIAESVRAHRGVSRAEALERAAEVLEWVGMPKAKERLSSFPHQLSGGLRQRAMIAIALACEPKVLIADEPTTALDVTIQAQILELLDELKARLGMAILLITHDMGVIAGRADRVLVMYAGRIVESAETVSIFEDMRHPYTEALLDSMPELGTERSATLYSIPGLPPDLSQPLLGCRFAPRCRHVETRCHVEEPELESDGRHAYACFVPRVGSAERGSRIRARYQGDSEYTASHRNGDATPLVVVSGLVKEFPITKGVLQRKVGAVKAVSDVSFDIRRGETFALVGESGCGKTTLGRLISGYERPDQGSIAFDGTDIARLRGRRLRELRRHVQLVMQDPYSALDPRMRVRSTLKEPLAAQGIGTRADREHRVQAILREVGMPEGSVERYPHQFSGGQRQRIGIARALTLEPRLLVADEPVSALDVSIQSQILNLMRDLKDRTDLSFVVISHDLAVVRYLADRVAVMYMGKLVEIGAADDIYDGAAHPYTATLLNAVPLPDPRVEHAKEPITVRGELPSATNPPPGCRFHTRCPFAQDICTSEEPPLRVVNGRGHQAACHFPISAA